MIIRRQPSPVLRPFIKLLWVADETSVRGPAEADREHVLPTGQMHLVFRLSDQPLRLFDGGGDVAGRLIGLAVVGGARSGFYVRDISKPSCSAGAVLHPGAAEILFGAPAGELAERHTLLDDLWGRSVNSMREQLLEAPSPDGRLDILESILAAKLPAVRGLHPVVASALEQFWTTTDVRKVVISSGYSHRQFIARFRDAVGLTPKLYCRILRFQKMIGFLAADPSVFLADLAIDAGYSDQPHLTREFREFAGVTPEQYRKISPASTHHVPLMPSSR